MNAKNLLLVLLVALLGGAAGAWVFENTSPADKQAAPVAQESVYDRVMRTQTIRLGYGVWAPLMAKDPNTGQLSGIFYDYFEALGKALNLKIEWGEEIGLGDFPAALATGRIDGMIGVWPNASRARQIDATRPIYYSGIYAFARADDHRFDGDLTKINDPSIKIVSMDGEMASLIAANDFPKASMLTLPQLTNISDFLLNVSTGKADVTFVDPSIVVDFIANNPGKVRLISNVAPLRVFGDTIGIKGGEDRFRRMIDTATDELLASGQIEKILTKYEKTPGSFLRAAPPYQTMKSAL